MQITPVNNIAFKSFLPPESKVKKGDYTRDYWGDFYKACSMSAEKKDKLDTLLRELANNGDNNILALETTRDVTDGFQHNYYFRLYASNNDLLADRKKEGLCDRDNDLTKRIWIQPRNDFYGDGNFVELEEDFDIGKKANLAHCGKYFTATNITSALLYCLEKIVRDPEKRMFDLNNIEPSKYLKRFRAKV